MPLSCASDAALRRARHDAPTTCRCVFCAVCNISAVGALSATFERGLSDAGSASRLGRQSAKHDTAVDSPHPRNVRATPSLAAPPSGVRASRVSIGAWDTLLSTRACSVRAARESGVSLMNVICNSSPAIRRALTVRPVRRSATLAAKASVLSEMTGRSSSIQPGIRVVTHARTNRSLDAVSLSLVVACVVASAWKPVKAGCSQTHCVRRHRGFG